MLGLRCCVRAFLSLCQVGATLCCGAWASHCCGFPCCGARALGTRASAVAAHRLGSCGSWALESGAVVVAHGLSCSAACGNLPRPGLEPVYPALAGRLLTTAPPGKFYGHPRKRILSCVSDSNLACMYLRFSFHFIQRY